MQELAKKWIDIGGTTKQHFPSLYLYWDEINHRNHIHLFYVDTDEKWQFNIKCNNKRIDRIKHDIDIYESLDDFIKTLQRLWIEECPAFFRHLVRVQGRVQGCIQERVLKILDN